MRDDVRSIGRCQIMKSLFYTNIPMNILIYYIIYQYIPMNIPMNTLRIPNYNVGSQSIIFPKTHEDNLLCQ